MSEFHHRRWYAFRLRTLLVVVLVVGCVLTPVAIGLRWLRLQKETHRRQREIVEWVARHGGGVEYVGRSATIKEVSFYGSAA